jgi:hypothetical protein
MVVQNDWPLLSEAFDRLATYEALPQFNAYDVMRAASDIVGRAQIRLTGTRSDILGNITPEPIEGLLAKAARANVFSCANEIVAHYEDTQDVRSSLGPRSNLRQAAWSGRLGDGTIKFRTVRVHWLSLAGALTAAGFAADAEQSSRRGAYKGELAAFIRLNPEMVGRLSDDQVVLRFIDYVEAKTKRGRSVLRLPQPRHIAIQVAKIRAQLAKRL